MPTEHFSPIYKDHRPNVDAGPVAVCRAAGALIYGKTVSLLLLSATAVVFRRGELTDTAYNSVRSDNFGSSSS